MNEEEKCPVDHKARAAWLEHAKASGQQPPHPIPSTASSNPIPQGESCDSAEIDQSTPSAPKASSIFSGIRLSTKLGQDRETSTIPRAAPTVAQSLPQRKNVGPASHGTLANNEQESGRDKSGNWIYPSEQMFFDAMRRKNFDPQAQDMKSIVPIHNAVNERAWKEIRVWEQGKGSEA